jgi:hypothetical protein
MFNVGVETGQVLFVVGVTLLLEALRRLLAGGAQALVKAAPYAIGSIAAFWTVERFLSFMP